VRKKGRWNGCLNRDKNKIDEERKRKNLEMGKESKRKWEKKSDE